MLRLLLLSTLLLSCSVPNNPVRLDYLGPFLSEWCEFRAQCGIRENFDQCYRHNIAHWCGIADVCYERIDDQGTLEPCLEGLREYDESCQIAGFGALPHECAEFVEIFEDGFR